MNTYIKNILGIVIILLIALVGFVFWQYTSTRVSRTFQVNGQGKVNIVPDLAAFTFSVITQGDKDIGSLQKENTDKVNAAIDFIKSKGVDSKDIKTQNYNLSPRYQSYSCPVNQSKPCPPPDIIGYTISQSVSVKIRDFSKIGDILVKVVEYGANQLPQLSFTLEDPTAAQNEARAKAIEDAKEKAKTMADAGGFRLGKLLNIGEGYVSSIGMPYAISQLMPATGAGAPAAPTPTIEPGSQDVSANVTLTYEIK